MKLLLRLMIENGVEEVWSSLTIAPKWCNWFALVKEWTIEFPILNGLLKTRVWIAFFLVGGGDHDAMAWVIDTFTTTSTLLSIGRILTSF